MRTQLKHSVVIATIASTAALAHATFTIDWSTVDCGGGPVSGGTFALEGSIGQHDADTPITGGSFTISPGYQQSFAPPPVCVGDLNNDGARNTADLVIFLANFGQTVPPGLALADFNNDTLINTADLVVFLGNFGVSCP